MNSKSRLAPVGIVGRAALVLAAGVVCAWMLTSTGNAARASAPTVTVPDTAPDQTTPVGQEPSRCSGKPTTFSSPTRLVAGPYVFRDARSGGYVMLFRLNRDPLNCVNNTRGTFRIAGVSVADGEPEFLNSRAQARASHRYCFKAILDRDPTDSLQVKLDRLHAGATVEIDLRPYSRLGNGRTGLIDIKRRARLQSTPSMTAPSASYREAVRKLNCR